MKKVLDKTEVADNVELVIEKHLQLSVVGQSCYKELQIVNFSFQYFSQ
jgi:hypothetical protein